MEEVEKVAKQTVGLDGYKVCIRCKINKPLDQFSKRPERACGVRSRCKSCDKEARTENIDRFRELSKEYYSKNKEDIIAKRKSKPKTEEQIKMSRIYQKRYKEKIKGKLSQEKIIAIRETRRKYRESHKEQIKLKNTAYWKENKEKLSKENYSRKKERLENDFNYRMRELVSAGFKSAMKKHEEKKTSGFFSYSGIHARKYVEHFMESEYWEAWKSGENIHIDHIIPCSIYDYKDKEDIKRCWNPRNLRLLPASENISKRDIVDMDLIKRYGITDLMPKGWSANG